MLKPRFSPHEYRVQLPLLRTNAKVTASSPDGTDIEFNGVHDSSEELWTSPRLVLHGIARECAVARAAERH
jgi:hypothetical protein